MSNLYECRNGHLKRDVKATSTPDGAFGGLICVDCGAPASRVIV